MSDTTTHTNNSVPEHSPHLMTDNWDTGKLADSIEIISVDGDPTQLLVDGEPFPYLLAQGSKVNIIGDESDAPEETAWGTVAVTLFAQRITETERPRSTAPRTQPDSK